jgi:hypothetical protein
VLGSVRIREQIWCFVAHGARFVEDFHVSPKWSKLKKIPAKATSGDAEPKWGVSGKIL